MVVTDTDHVLTGNVPATAETAKVTFPLPSPNGVFLDAAHPNSCSAALTSQPLCYSIQTLAAGFASLPCPSPHAHTALGQGFSSALPSAKAHKLSVEQGVPAG